MLIYIYVFLFLVARVDTSAAKRFVRNALWAPSSGKDQGIKASVLLLYS